MIDNDCLASYLFTYQVMNVVLLDWVNTLQTDTRFNRPLYSLVSFLLNDLNDGNKVNLNAH